VVVTLIDDAAEQAREGLIPPRELLH